MNPLLILIIQISVIIIASRVIGLLFRKIHQPQVVGEMTAGILLGPSVLGWLAPGVSSFIFPPQSLQYLNILSQIGLLLFMFLVGLELDPKLLKGRGHSAVLISHFSIILPFLFGTTLALHLYPLLSNDSITFTAFALFLGASMSITAFPVLARILTERNLISTKLGAVTITCAAIDDVTAWSILAIVITIARTESSHVPLWLTITGTFVFILLMIFLIRPFLSKLEIYYLNRGNKLTHDILGLVVLLMFASAWTTEWLGIHALFGSFLMGAMMPRNKSFIKDIFNKLNDVTLILLLPIFFALTGLKTSIGLISGTEMWIYFFLILLAAIGGKLGGSFVAARITTLNLREALGVGILMNTRGLMELVILSIGLEFGVISPALFAMMVMMALITTFMATPFFEWAYPKSLIKKDFEEAEKKKEKFGILIPVSFPSSGPGLLKIASAISPDPDMRIYALHLTKPADTLFSNTDNGTSLPNFSEALTPLLKSAEEQSIKVHPLSFITRNPADDIIQTAEVKDVNMILMGWHKPIMQESILSGTVNEVFKNAKVDVCVYLERQFNSYKNILVPFKDGVHDREALNLAYRITNNIGARLTVLHIVKPNTKNLNKSSQNENSSLVKELIGNFPGDNVELLFIESEDPLNTTVEIAQQNFDLIVLGLSETWGFEPSLFSKRHEMLAFKCQASILILRKYSW